MIAEMWEFIKVSSKSNPLQPLEIQDFSILAYAENMVKSSLKVPYKHHRGQAKSKRLVSN